MQWIFAVILLLWASAVQAQEEVIKAGGIGSSGRYNPDIGVNLLILGRYEGHVHEHGDENQDHAKDHSHSEAANGTSLTIQEVEFSFSAGIDPYFLGQLTMAVEGEEIHLEEGFALLYAIPMINIKAGKFFASFGRHNLLHTHAFPFIDPPLVLEKTFGDHGLLETGVSASFLVPVPWFLEITGEILNGNNKIFTLSKSNNENDVHNLPDNNSPEHGGHTDASQNVEDFAYLLNVKTLFDLSEETTIQFGGSYLFGKNSQNWWSYAYGADLTLKWRPLRRARYLGLTFQNEYVASVKDRGSGKKEKGDGLYSLLMFQFARNWWVEGRYDMIKGFEENKREWRASGLIAFVPTEYSALRLQYNYNKPSGSHEVMLQLNVTFGKHPAHMY